MSESENIFYTFEYDKGVSNKNLTRLSIIVSQHCRELIILQQVLLFLLQELRLLQHLPLLLRQL